MNEPWDQLLIEELLRDAGDEPADEQTKEKYLRKLATFRKLAERSPELVAGGNLLLSIFEESLSETSAVASVTQTAQVMQVQASPAEQQIMTMGTDSLPIPAKELAQLAHRSETAFRRTVENILAEMWRTRGATGDLPFEGKEIRMRDAVDYAWDSCTEVKQGYIPKLVERIVEYCVNQGVRNRQALEQWCSERRIAKIMVELKMTATYFVPGRGLSTQF